MDFFSGINGFLADISVMHRAGLSFVTSLFLVLILGNPYIRAVKASKKLLQPIRTDGPQTHLVKAGTPTMGGLLIMLCFWVSTLFWVANINVIISIILFVSLGFTLLGFLDDILKLALKNSKGLNGKFRLVVGTIISLIAMYYLVQEYPVEIAKSVFFPFINSFYIPIGIGILFFGSFVIVGTANSVNLTDGLDGLASMVVATILLSFLLLVILIITPGVYTTFLYSSLFYFNNIIEVLVLCSALIGALLGFLWFNSYPAKIFMGDVGSLGIGATLGVIAVALKQEVFLAVAGIFLVIESLSVIIQVYNFKLTGKRVFLMAPIHHHFEKKGVFEITVVKRIWIFTIASCVVALLLLDI